MSFLKTIFAGALSLTTSDSATAEPLTPQDIGAFHDLVATGTTTDVFEALRHAPELATAPDQYGFQAIHLLDYAQFHEKLALLLKSGADINAVNNEGHTLLHILVDPSFLSTVVHDAAKIDIRDKHGRTPLMLHLTEPDGTAFLDEFLDAGANPNAKDNHGRSVLDYLKAHNDPQAEALLRQAGARD